MTEAVVRWETPEDTPWGFRNLQPVDDDHVRVAELRSKVRAAGEYWTGDRAGDLTALLDEAAATDPKLAELVRVGGALLQDFLEGHRRRTGTARVSRDVVADLIDGRPVPREVYDDLAARYVVVAVHAPDRGRALLDAAGPGVLTTQRGACRVLLVPDVSEDLTNEVLQRLTGALGQTGRLALASRSKSDLPDGFAEASEVLRLVLAGRRPSGAYAIEDVLVEYAVTRHDRVTGHLVAMIRPLRRHDVLWETLVALVDADFNRNQAAKDLFIHRSTVDYRLQRIAAITGWDPTTGRGGQVLSAALVAEALSS